jgi:cell division protein FtsL
MAHYLTLTPTWGAKIGRRKKTIKKNFQAGPVTLGYIAVFLIALISLFYLFQIISISAAGYEVSEIGGQITELEKQNRNLQLEINEAQSLRQIESNLDQSGMVPVNQKAIKFVDEQGVIAVR